MIVKFPPMVKEIVGRVAKSGKWEEMGVLHDLLVELGVDSRIWIMVTLREGECKGYVIDDRNTVLQGFAEVWDYYDTRYGAFISDKSYQDWYREQAVEVRVI